MVISYQDLEKIYKRICEIYTKTRGDLEYTERWCSVYSRELRDLESKFVYISIKPHKFRKKIEIIVRNKIGEGGLKICRNCILDRGGKL